MHAVTGGDHAARQRYLDLQRSWWRLRHTPAVVKHRAAGGVVRNPERAVRGRKGDAPGVLQHLIGVVCPTRQIRGEVGFYITIGAAEPRVVVGARRRRDDHCRRSGCSRDYNKATDVIHAVLPR
jgi:hypothetical protein